MAIIIINGSPSGKHGNCQILIQKICVRMKLQKKILQKHDLSIIHLADTKWTATEKKKIWTQLIQSDGFIFVTGTYWDSWGSPLQLFLENVTDLEGSKTFLGKPALVVVLNHSVGGKGVLSRLQGVLSTLGFLIPPMSGMVYAWVSQQALKKNSDTSSAKDLWSLQDLDNLIENFHKALQIKIDWKSWPVDRKNYRQIWLKS